MIDKKYITRVLSWMICLVAVVLMTACAEDKLFGSSADGAEKEGLSISLSLDGMQLASRSANVPSLNENVVKKMDVFLFGPNETFMKHVVAGDGTASVEKVTLYQGSSWKTEFAADSEYTLYVLANYKGDTDLETINTVQGLKDLVAKDAEVAVWEGMNNYTDKTFLMDGKKVFKGSDLPTDQSTYNINVDVKHAAIKIEVTVKFSDDWKSKFTANGLEAQFTNYATATAALEEAPMLDADEREFTTFPAATSNVLDRFSADPIYEKGQGGTIDGSKILFYAYVNDWEQAVDNETMFLIDLPGSIKKEDGTTSALAHNFYKIPIVPNSQEKVLKRNTFYQVTAVVDMEGSSTIDVPVELKDVKIEVADWKSTDVNVGTGDNPEYLMLNEYHVEIRNADGYDGLRFYSSAPIDNVEIVGFNDQSEATKAGVDFTYPGDKTLEGSGRYENETDKIPGAFYVNKDNKRKSVSGISVDFESNVNNGWIHLYSQNPENVTKRYITLKVTSGDNVKYVVVEQYPLEYIQPIAGWYSYRDDLKSKGGTYEEHGTSSGSSSNTTRYFTPKVVKSSNYGKDLYEWYWTYTYYGGWSLYDNTAANTGNDNNMMYFVTITQTSENYKLAHPVTESINGNQLAAVSSSENDQLVSPSFMLASTLGAVSSSNLSGWKEAQNHCSYYVEAYQWNGKTYYLDDWRLPTTAEIKVIIDYQNNDNVKDVMTPVLTGANYYVSYQYANDDRGTASTGYGNSGNFVRCIRDVKPTDEFLQK